MSLPIKEARIAVDYRGLLLSALAKRGASASAYRVDDKGAIDYYTNRNGWERLCSSLEALKEV